MHERIKKILSHPEPTTRWLLAGKESVLDDAFEIAAQFQQTTVKQIKQDPDVKIVKDLGESIKIGNRETPEPGTVREIIKWVHQKPIAPYRIVIIENFERVGRDAVHAFLKILEEPPGRTCFIFTTQNHFSLIETILSRLTVVNCYSSIDRDFTIDDDVQNFLQQGKWIESFKYIEELDKKARAGDKINRKIFLDFLKALYQHARLAERFYPALPLILSAQEGISRNQNPKFLLENLCVQLGKKEF